MYAAHIMISSASRTPLCAQNKSHLAIKIGWPLMCAWMDRSASEAREILAIQLNFQYLLNPINITLPLPTPPLSEAYLETQLQQSVGTI